MLNPAEIMLRPAETNVEWLRHPVEALGRVLALLQGLGGYTHGYTDAPPRRKLHKFEELKKLQALALGTLSHAKQGRTP